MILQGQLECLVALSCGAGDVHAGVVVVVAVAMHDTQRANFAVIEDLPLSVNSTSTTRIPTSLGVQDVHLRESEREHDSETTNKITALSTVAWPRHDDRRSQIKQVFVSNSFTIAPVYNSCRPARTLVV